MRCVNNSETPKARALSADIASSEYVERVAVPVMGAVDGMPTAYRALVNEYGYVDVYRAWRGGWTPTRIVAKATANGGFFVY